MAKIIWSPLAIQDLEEIKEYISIDSRKNANEFVEKLLEYPNKLLTFSNIGRNIPGCDIMNAKEVFFCDYRIAYRKRDENIEIMTVHHGSKLSKILSS